MQTDCAQPIAILTYHQIAPAPAAGTPFADLTVPPQRFARHMARLRALGYTGLSMQALRPYLQGKRRGRVFGLTFDDGYRNVLEHALPVLARLGFSATSYMVAGRAGGHNDWDTGQGIAAAPLVDAAQMREWIAAGNEVGSHTIDHADLTACAPAEAERQIAGSRRMLQDMLGSPVDAFCFPYGRFDAAHVEMARRAGYRDATTIEPGRVRSGCDMLRLPRIMMYGSTGFAKLALQLGTPLEDLRGWRRARRAPAEGRAGGYR